MSNEPLWRTDDMGLASFLALRLPLLKVAWTSTSCYWYFEDTDELEELVGDYLFGDATVNPREYNDMNALLKRSIFESRDGQPVTAIEQQAAS